MTTYTVFTNHPRPRELYVYQGKNAKRDAERHAKRHHRETGFAARVIHGITK